MKLLFVQPTYYQDAACRDPYNLVPPMSLASMASVAQRRGHECRILDIIGREELLGEALHRFSPDIVCVTALTTFYADAVRLIHRLRREHGFDGRIIFGGVHPTLEPLSSLRQSGADIVVVGEGEETFDATLAAIERSTPLADIPGLCLPELGLTPARPRIADLDVLPMPAFDLFEIGSNSPYAISTVFVEVHRGCPFTCAYCSSKFLYGASLRARSPETVVRDVTYLKTRFGLKEWQPISDTFVFNLDWLQRFAPLIEPLGMRYRVNGKFNVMKPATFDALQRSGCYQIDYGVESAVPRILKNIDKFSDMTVAERVIEETVDRGFECHLYFMLSLPGESYDDMMTTIDFARRMKTRFGCHTEFQITRLYPNTPMMAQWKGVVEDWTEVRHPNLPYPTIPAYFELDPERVVALWKQACAEIKARTFREHLQKTIPDMIRSARTPQQFLRQFVTRAWRKLLLWFSSGR